MGLHAEGTIFLIIAWGSVFFLLIYCYKKVLNGNGKQNKKE